MSTVAPVQLESDGFYSIIRRRLMLLATVCRS